MATSSRFEILYLCFRTVEMKSAKKTPEFQILFKFDDVMDYREEGIRTIIKLKVLPKTELKFKLIVYQPDDIFKPIGSILYQEIQKHLDHLKPQTFCLSCIEPEENLTDVSHDSEGSQERKSARPREVVNLVFDAFRYCPSEDTVAKDEFLLIDFKLLELNTEALNNEESKPGIPYGQSSFRYKLEFDLLKQKYSVEFRQTNTLECDFNRNVFVASKDEKASLNIKLFSYERKKHTDEEVETEVSKATIPLQKLLKNNPKVGKIDIYDKFYIKYSVANRVSSFMNDFIGDVNFRVLSAKFYQSAIQKPTLTLRQLGSTIQWTLNPFSTVVKDNEYYCDFLFNKIRTDIEDQQNKQIQEKYLAGQAANKTTKSQSKTNEQAGKGQDANKSTKMQPDTSELPQNINDLELIIKDQVSRIERGGVLVPIKKGFIDPELERTRDLIQKFEDQETIYNNKQYKQDSITHVYQQNGSYFYSCVPNETIVLEVYEGPVLKGYAFFPLANINMNQNFFEEIIPVGLPQKRSSQKFGEVMIRAEFEPSKVEVQKDLFQDLQTLDFDDISERFDNSSDLFEAYLLMDSNLEKSKSLIWPQKITNLFTDFSKPKVVTLNLVDIWNLTAIYSSDFNLNEYELKVRISDDQQCLTFSYDTIDIEAVRKTYSKEFFLMTELAYNQTLITRQKEEESIIILKIPDKTKFGVITIKQNPNYAHFKFVVNHPKESCSIALYKQGNAIDYQIYTLDALPISNGKEDVLVIPIQIPYYSGKELIQKRTLLLKLQTEVNDQDDEQAEVMMNNFSSGIFSIKRIKIPSDYTKIENYNSKLRYNIEVQRLNTPKPKLDQNKIVGKIPSDNAQIGNSNPTLPYNSEVQKVNKPKPGQNKIAGKIPSDNAQIGNPNPTVPYNSEAEGLNKPDQDEIVEKPFHKLISFGGDISLDRTSFEHIADFQKPNDESSIKFKITVTNVSRLMKYVDNGIDQKVERESLVTKFFSVKQPKEPYTCVKKDMNIEDPTEIDGEEDIKFPLRFQFTYKVSLFIDAPSGKLTIKFDQSEIDFLRKHTSLAKVNNLKIHIADPGTIINYEPEYVFLDRSLEDESNQKTIQTHQWTNKLLIESYDFDKLLGRTLVQLSDLPFVNKREPVQKMIVINGVRVTLNLLYQPFKLGQVKEGEEEEEEEEEGSVVAEKSGDQSKKAAANERSKIQFLKNKIKQMENDNLVARTKINKTNMERFKKEKAIEKLLNYHKSYERYSQRAFEPSESRGTTKSNYSKSTANTVNTAALNDKAKQQYSTICKCGRAGPKFKGYCSECVKTLVKEYKRCMEDYEPIAEEFEKIVAKIDTLEKKKKNVDAKVELYKKKENEFNYDFLNEEEEFLKDEIKNLEAKLTEKTTDIEILRSEYAFSIDEMRTRQHSLEGILAKKKQKLAKLNKLVEIE